MKGYGIYVKNDLLDPKHRKGMGAALWLYLWLLDRMTSINEQGVGKVLGGKPITFEEINEDLDVPKRTYLYWVSKLKDAGYINTIRAPYGLVFSVNKAVKSFSRDRQKVAYQRSARNAPRSARMLPRDAKNATSNKTIQDSTRHKGKNPKIITVKEDGREYEVVATDSQGRVTYE